MSGTALLGAIGNAVRGRATCAIEWRHEKRRRLFFFQQGELVLVQSNLKSESPERVAERQPGLSPALLAARTTAVRVAEAVAEPVGDVTVHADAPAPGREPIDLFAMLWEASARLRPPAGSMFPRIAPGGDPLLARFPVGAELRGYLRDLDGTRPVDDVVAFGPAEPAEVTRALALALAIGAVEAGAAPVGATVTSSSPANSAKPPGSSRAGLDEIAGFIQAGLDDAPEDGETVVFSAGRPVLAPRAPAPAARPAPAVDPVAARFGLEAARIRNAKDHFEVLGTSWQDDGEGHRRAYIALAQRLHPDRVGGDGPEVVAVAEELFEKVRTAWEVLGDDAKREAYIARTIRGEKTEDEKAMDRVRSIMDAEAAFKRGVIELNAGRLPVAHEQFQRATTAVPEEHEFAAYAGYTTWRLNFGRDADVASEGLKRLHAAVQANEKMDGAWVLLGMALRGQGNDEAARRAFVTALKLKPSNPDAVREMRRMEREKETTPPPPAAGSFFSKLFGKK